MKKLFIVMMILLSTMIITNNVFAHSGRLDSSGGHNDRSNGTYHYHQSPGEDGGSDSLIMGDD
ncbi:MAG: YHYH domain-containing protein [Alphaproteobacteria bacterium]